MTPMHLFKSIVVAAVLGYLATCESEARVITQQELINQANSLQVDKSEIPMLMQAVKNLEQGDGDDDDDDDMYNSQDSAQQLNNKQIVSQPTNQEYQALPATAADLKASASHHHHGHHAKGWLDMGAWTGKKGSFGWYDKHPVGKGK